MTAGRSATGVLDCPLPPEGFIDATIPVHELNLSVTNLYSKIGIADPDGADWQAASP
jgi:hypothetical protein